MHRWIRVIALTVGAGLVTMATSTPLAAAVLPAGFVEATVASGLRRPTAMAVAPDGRIFVCEQEGALRVVKDNVLLPTAFTTLTVNASGERGLLGVALDPAFEDNGFVYVYYTATTPTVHNRVSRFTAAGDVAAGGETILLELDPLGASNHNGGAIHFGVDGKLYVAVGDNAVGTRAPRLDTRFGKILRINSDGSIPDDNPFAAVTTGVNQAIWARGLRNPYTFAIQPIAGTIYINDVGENSLEEVNPGVAGADYGWPASEGPSSDPGVTSPLHAYSHADGCAISGGAFHNPLRAHFPARYWGVYFFADYCGGWIRHVDPSGVVGFFATGISRPVDLAAAPDGGLYYLARGTGDNTGLLRHITYPVTRPRTLVTVNGTDGPISLSAGDALQLQVTFDSCCPILGHNLYLGITTPSGTFWLNQDGQWGTIPTHATTVTSSFGPSTIVGIPDVAVLPPGPIWWFVLMDYGADPGVESADVVLTIISP